MGRKKAFTKERKLPQAQSAEEIAARDAREEVKAAQRAGRRKDCDDKPKKKKGAADESDSDSDFSDDSDDGMAFDRPAMKAEESSSEEEEEEKGAKPKTLMDQLGVELEGAVNLNVAAKGQAKAVSAKNMKLADVGDKPELSRKEREAIEAQRKEAAYRKKHEAGETDEAKADLARLAEVRRKREEAKKKREAEAEAAKEEAEKADEKKGDKKKPAEAVELTMPTQKEVKSALRKIKDCANDDYQKKWKLDKMSGNKLAKVKYGEFTKMWEDFVANCSDKEHREYAA